MMGCSKALRLLIRQGRSIEAIQRTVAWDRLTLLKREATQAA